MRGRILGARVGAGRGHRAGGARLGSPARRTPLVGTMLPAPPAVGERVRPHPIGRRPFAAIASAIAAVAAAVALGTAGCDGDKRAPGAGGVGGTNNGAAAGGLG